jgi:hypothetical protein
MPARLPEGFSYRERKSGEIEVLHFGRLAALLRSGRAERFRARGGGDEVGAAAPHGQGDRQRRARQRAEGGEVGSGRVTSARTAARHREA